MEAVSILKPRARKPSTSWSRNVWEMAGYWLSKNAMESPACGAMGAATTGSEHTSGVIGSSAFIN